MPRVRGGDEAERQDEGGNPTVDVRHVFADRGHAPTGRGTRQAARRVPRLAARPRLPVRVRRERRFEGPAQAQRVVPEHPARHPAVQGETPHGDGGRHVHGPRPVPGHVHRRRKRRDAGHAMAPERVEGRVHGAVLAHPRARRADHGRASRRRRAHAARYGRPLGSSAA